MTRSLVGEKQMIWDLHTMMDAGQRCSSTLTANAMRLIQEAYINTTLFPRTVPVLKPHGMLVQKRLDLQESRLTDNLASLVIVTTHKPHR